jgi:hypothetical protein
MSIHFARNAWTRASFYVNAISLSFLLTLLPDEHLQAQKIYLVDASKTQNTIASGLTVIKPVDWDSACGNLQTAIDSAKSSDQIWVRAGTYFPTKDRSGNDVPVENQSARTFMLKNGVRLYGGFGGSELTLSARNLSINTSVLSGKYLQGTPAFSVVTIINADTNTVINGFQITGGSAGDGNNGGGIYCEASSVNIVNCIISGNSSAGRAGGLYNLNASPLLLNCLFTSNTASFGAAVYNANSSPRIINCTVTSNKSNGPGGGVFNESPSAPVIANSILWDNSGGNNKNDNIYFSTGTASGTVEYSIIGQASGRYPGTNNFNNSPLFANASQGNYRCLPGSPAVDGGNNLRYLSGFSTTDVSGQTRISNIIDLGVYEGAGIPVVNASNVVYVNSSNGNISGNGSSWGEAFTSLADAIQFVNFSPTAFTNGVKEVWVAKGTYQPAYNLAGKLVPSDPRALTFSVKDSIKLYGGFSGKETNAAQRNAAQNLTTLNGFMNVSPGYDLRSYNIISVISSARAPTIDGFTITEGLANNLIHGGGGLYAERSTLIVSNCRFIKNDHSAIWNYFSNLTLKSCYFTENTSNDGGGLYNLAGKVDISDCNFYNNGDDRDYGTGGAIVNESTTNTGVVSIMTITRTSFRKNHVRYSCAAIQNGGRLSIYNCEFIDNYTIYLASGILGSGGEQPVVIVNTIFANNHVFSNTVSNSGQMYLINSVITNNVGYREAGVVVGSLYNTDRTIVSNSIIWGNRSEERGQWGNNISNGKNYSTTEGFFINHSIIGNYVFPGRPAVVFPA